MKVSNKRNIGSLGLYYLFIIPILLMILIYHYMIINKIDWIIMAMASLLTAIIISLYNLRFKEFENSGFVITITKRHPLLANRFPTPVLEFPVQLLKSFQVKGNKIYLYFNSSNKTSEKTIVFKLLLNGFSKEQCDQIIESLSQVKGN